jgi:hypothetical protein
MSVKEIGPTHRRRKCRVWIEVSIVTPIAAAQALPRRREFIVLNRNDLNDNGLQKSHADVRRQLRVRFRVGNI